VVDHEASVGTRPSLAELSWLVGRWQGEAFGGQVEETWFPPAGGAMVGVFRLVKDGEVQLYELYTLDGEDLTVRLKHFDAALVGWEERERVVEFPFRGAAARQITFEGLRFALLPDGRLQAVVLVGPAAGPQEVELLLTKAGCF
jgi:hypothetical protein